VLYRLLVLTLLAGCAPVDKSPAAPSATRLPSATIAALDGAPTTLTAALAGRPALVSLWATWCEACMRELEPLARLHGKAGAQGGVVVAVAVGEPREKVRAFVAERHLVYRQLVDETFAFADALGARRVPATLVVDAGGNIVFSGGELDAAALEAFRRELGRASASRQ
jgi:thiol-disulfide isomerase/thioredoxin